MLCGCIPVFSALNFNENDSGLTLNLCLRCSIENDDQAGGLTEC